MEEHRDVKSGDAKASPRARILDAAALVMRDKGLVKTTTKEIARAAGYSEAMLYKHFTDKQELFEQVLLERLPAVHGLTDFVGVGELEPNIAHIVEQFMRFFTLSFPMAASIFGSPDLLRSHRESAQARGFGPYAPKRIVREYLEEEQKLGRIRSDADLEAVDTLMVGSAFHQAFLAAFEGLETVPDAERKARAIAASIMPALT